MEPITMTVLAGLARYVPDLVKWVSGSDKAEEIAIKAIDIAKVVTGQPTGDAALAALEADPALVLQFKKSVLDQEVEFQALAVKNAADVNVTMQTEAGSEHWPTYSWRPSLGFAVALTVVITSLTVAAAFIGVMFFSREAAVLQYVPGMIGAMAALIGVVVPVLGIASWYRGKMQADPSIFTNNKG